MLLKAAVAGAIVIAAAGAIERLAAQPAVPAARLAPRPLNAADRERVERAIAVSTRRYDEWLGPSRAGDPLPLNLDTPVWTSPSSMRLESQIAFALARERFAPMTGSGLTSNLVDGIAWHLQSRVVEELFDLAEQQPGHHAVDAGMFGGLVRWGFPSLVVQRTGPDERGSLETRHAAAAVATLERVVGWPALAGALRVLIAVQPAPAGPQDAARTLEAALGVPLDWFVAALAPGFRVNYRLVSVEAQSLNCGEPRCYRTAIAVARDGEALFAAKGSPATPLAIAVEFNDGATSMLAWSGNEAERSFVTESLSAPVAVTLDPGHVAQLDDHPLDQQWRAAAIPHPLPVKSLVAWVVWLQHAALTYNVLL